MTPRSTKPQTGALAALVGAACAALCTPLVAGFEGTRTKAYQDVAGVWTICTGETLGVKAGQVATLSECGIRLDSRLADHAAPVLACAPSLRGHDNQAAAAISLAYNIGTSAFCSSTVARRLNAHQWAAACDAFLLWTKAGGRVVQGLVHRRRAERALCMKELPSG